jgi:hypothetical protein
MMFCKSCCKEDAISKTKVVIEKEDRREKAEEESCEINKHAEL